MYMNDNQQTVRHPWKMVFSWVFANQLLLLAPIFRSMEKEKRVEYMFMTLGSIVGRLLHLRRTCAKCKRDQIVPLAKKHEIVSCKFCGAKVPPPEK